MIVTGACLIGQSGGPTAVINASLLGVIQTATKNPHITKVYGAINGLSGIIDRNIIDFSQEDPQELSYLLHTPAAAIGSVRYKMPHHWDDPSIYQKILALFKELDIHYFFYIGGNDSMDTCNKISQFFKEQAYYCNVIGIPKTIDNDLVLTDHCPGYGSSIKYIAYTLQSLYLDLQSYHLGRVTVVEVMGRDTGWLTAAAKLACLPNGGPDLIYVPEVAFCLETFLTDIYQIYQKKKFVLVVVAEGIKTANGEYLLNYREFNTNDDFGHIQLGGVASILAQAIYKRYQLPVRPLELNLPQRCFAPLLSKTDVLEAYQCGEFALNQAVDGHTGKMVAMKRISDQPYQIKLELVELNQVANKVKLLPQEFINKRGNHITSKFKTYASELIKGELQLPYYQEMPRFANLKKINIFNDNK